jgi:nitrate/TMAO reductase-like tetraheme cytochrome c subunit
MKLPKTYYNPISLVGSIIASVSALIIVFFMATSWIFEGGGAYSGVIIYIVLPIFLIIGLIMIPVGIRRRARRIRKEGEEGTRAWIVIDLRDSRQWNAVAIFIIVTIIFLVLTGIGTYEAFHYTESNEFCGTLCHQVMEPEYVAYQGSAHSRVTCVECHVGEGAGWYVNSKLSGLYQVYSVTFHKYPRPIETPIRNLRPARETCERCHWPEKFYSYRLRNIKNYLADSANTEWDIQLKMKIGSEHGAQGLQEGVHWHINPDVKIDYVSSNEKREFIPWVRYVNTATGDTVIYQDIYETLDEVALDTLEMREMDCLDCHNRPSHNFLPPQEFTDDLITAGMIPSDLPEIKLLAMQIFNHPFTTRDSGSMYIRETVREYYLDNYPDIAETNGALIEQATEGLLEGYEKNFFPYMKANWDAYPIHIGHSEFNGCFRCHNGQHESEDGQVISRDCNLCHTILSQGPPDNLETTSVDSSLTFKHPVDIYEAWKEMACADCHRTLY